MQLNRQVIILATLGAIGIITGVALIYLPAAIILGGLILLVGAYLSLDVDSPN